MVTQTHRPEHQISWSSKGRPGGSAAGAGYSRNDACRLGKRKERSGIREAAVQGGQFTCKPPATELGTFVLRDYLLPLDKFGPPQYLENGLVL